MRAERLSMTKWVLVMVFTMGTALSASAQTATSTLTTTTNAPEGPKPAQPLVSGSFAVYRNTSLYDFQDGTRRDSADYVLKMGLKITPDYSLSVQGGYSQDLHHSEYDDFGDTSVSLGRKAIPLGLYVLLSPSITAIVPTSKMSHTVQNLESAYRVGASFSLNPVVNPNLVLGLGLSGGQNFHQYDTDINGNVLNQYSFNQTLIAGYNLGNFSLSAIYIHKNAWTYQHTLKEAFEHYEEIGYGVNNSLAVAIGHSNGGSALKANGSDSNLALINENDSMVYGALTLMF